MGKLYPWVRGPFEILHHAEGHYKKSSDIDRRLALISFDNAIEVAINTFLQLNSKIRGGIDYQKEMVDKWLRNYHSKIEFFEFFLQERVLSTSISTTEIIWYHTIRNEMYHSGNGFVPEIHCIKGIRTAAIEVINILFSINIKTVLDDLVYVDVHQESSNTSTVLNLFLRSFTTLERTIQGTALAIGVEVNSIKQAGNPTSLWRSLSNQMDSGITKYENVVQQAIKLRNEFFHTEITSLSSQEISHLIDKIDELTTVLQSHGFSLNILVSLTERYGDWVNESITSVRIVQKDGSSFLEVTYKTLGLFDEEIKRVNLDFIAGGDSKIDEPIFSPSYSAQYNADRFFDEMNLFSLLMTGIGDVLFTEKGLVDACKLCNASTDKPIDNINSRFSK